MQLHCSGPGPHDPADGVLGETDRPVAGLLCAPCAAAAAAAEISAPPGPPDLPTLADQVTALTDAVNLLILNSLGV